MHGWERESASTVQRIVTTPWLKGQSRAKGTVDDRDTDVYDDESHASINCHISKE